MGDVYRKARYVLVYPGEAPWNIELAALLVRVFETRNKSCDSEALAIFINIWFFCLCGRFPYWRYWTRMWVVQEIMLAKTAFLMLKRNKLDLQYFDFTDAVLGAGLQVPAWRLASLRHSYRQGPPTPNLTELIHETSGSACKETNDRVYALLGLLPKNIADMIPVDYDREWQLVVLDVLLATRNVHGGRISVIDVLEIFEGLPDPPSVVCGNCAKSSTHRLILPDSSTVRPISQLVNEEQEVFFIAGSIYSMMDPSNRPTSKIGWRPIEPITCIFCAVEVLPNYGLDPVLSRPLENVVCLKARERN